MNPVRLKIRVFYDINAVTCLPQAVAALIRSLRIVHGARLSRTQRSREAQGIERSSA